MKNFEYLIFLISSTIGIVGLVVGLLIKYNVYYVLIGGVVCWIIVFIIALKCFRKPKVEPTMTFIPRP